MANTGVIVPDDFREKARGILPATEYNVLMAYVEAGKHPLAPETAARFFELYLQSCDVYEIHRLNRTFPVEAIMWARVRHDWDQKRDAHAAGLMSSIQSKVAKAAMDSAGLVSDMIAAATKMHGDKIKKYLQTGNEADLGDAMSIANLGSLAKAIETLQKITGQGDPKKGNTLNVNISAGGAPGSSGDPVTPGNLSAEAAAKILSVITEDKRKNGK